VESEKQESLSEQVDHIIKESRMVLPGIQALFGFQLIAVFNQRFTEALPPAGRLLHLAALVLVAITVGLIMAPAAFHRQAEPERISRYFSNYASRLMTIAMAPFMLAIALEVALVAYVVKPVLWLSLCLGTVIAGLYLLLWFVFPWMKRAQHHAARAQRLSGQE